jgi:hypothetical protein
MNRILSLAAAVLSASILVACGPVAIVTAPIPPRPVAILTCVPGATVWIDGSLIDSPAQIADANGTVTFPAVSGAAGAFNIHARAPGYPEYGMVEPLPAGPHQYLVGLCVPLTVPGLQIQATPWLPIFPDPPTRDAILHAQGCFQGVTVVTVQFGELPMFDPALSSFSPADRLATYAAWHAANCQIVSLSITWDYGEAGQPYGSGQLVPPQDLRGGDLTALRTLLTEVIQHGFYVRLHLAGDGTDSGPYIYGYQALVNDLPRVIAGLRRAPDLTRYVVFVPGFDGIIDYNEQTQSFGPWSMAQLAGYLVQLRQLCGDCYSAVEPSIGPLGGTLPEFLRDASLTNYSHDEAYDALDQVLNEFPPDEGGQHGALSWQIADRLLGPTFIRPPDMVGDPSAPWADSRWSTAQPTSRGPIVGVAFEFSTYVWVRRQITAAAVALVRAYYRSMGYAVTG